MYNFNPLIICIFSDIQALNKQKEGQGKLI